jgi:hypothetical protein
VFTHRHLLDPATGNLDDKLIDEFLGYRRHDDSSSISAELALVDAAT